jgi:hypothetical protein
MHGICLPLRATAVMTGDKKSPLPIAARAFRFGPSQQRRGSGFLVCFSSGGSELTIWWTVCSNAHVAQHEARRLMRHLASPFRWTEHGPLCRADGGSVFRAVPRRGCAALGQWGQGFGFRRVRGMRLVFSSLGVWRIGGLKRANTSTALFEPDPHAVETNTNARGRGRTGSL